MVRRVRWVEGARQILGREEMEVLTDREYLCLGVEVVDG